MADVRIPTKGRNEGRRKAIVPRWLNVVVVLLVLVLAGAAVTIAVVWAKLPEIAADWASKTVGRSVKIGGLRLSPGRWMGVELLNARVANLPHGTRPDMATVARVTGEVALWPLLHGAVVARSVRVEKGDILLERVGQQPNWRNGPKQPETPGGRRDSFPTLLGADLQGVITFRTTSGHLLATTLDGVRVEAAAADAPVRIVGQGSYQGAPIALDLELGSYDQLHDAATPFPADIRMTSSGTVLHFVGTMTKPLDVNGADGQLSLDAPTPATLEKVAGADPSPAPPLRIAGALHHEANLWRLQQAKGAMGDAPLRSGTLQLQEGSTEAKTPDKIDLDLRFADVDADRLLAAFKGGNSGRPTGESSFVPQAHPDPEISAKLEATELSYGNVRVVQPKLSVTLAPNALTLDRASFGAVGGHVHLDGQIHANGKNGTLGATLTATGLGVAQLRRTLGVGPVPLAGRVDLHATADATGPTAAAALSAARASIVASMQSGSVSAQMVELASTDLAGLFQSARSMVPLDCLLAAAEVRGHVATVGPLRLRSARGTIVAGGEVDLLRETLDIVVASEAKTTGLLALDVPIRLTGRFDDPAVAPAGAAAGRAAASRSVGDLSPSVRTYALRSPCAR